MTAAPAATVIGARVPRREDAALLTGRGRFIGDVERARQAHAHIVRSPHAHARIVSIDTGDAAAAPGVVAVLTHRELQADGIAPLIEPNKVTGRGGEKTVNVAHPLLAGERAMHAGDPVAVVVAETRAAAGDAAELVQVEYEEIDAVVDGRTSLDASAPQLWPCAPGNVALDWEGGDADAVRTAFARAAHVTRLEIVNNRVVVAPMETRGVVAEYEPGSGRYTLWTPSQGVGSLLAPLARSLGVAESRIRVITNDVGGAFGIKIPPYPEHVLAAWAARRLGRPVKWIADRSESFLSDGQGRDHVTEAELALDAQGRFLAVRARTVSNMGAYTTMAAPTIPTVGGSRCITGVYRIPAWHARSRVVFTNTVPVHAYRGAGKPEYNHMIERLVDATARETGRDPAELRRLNVVPPEAMPYSTGTGIEFDSGEFAANMDDALALADRPGFEARREEARARGKLRGLGFALFQEPDGFLDNRVTLVFRPSGELTVTLTGQAGGHGHETTFAQVASDRLGVGVRLGPGGAGRQRRRGARERLGRLTHRDRREHGRGAGGRCDRRARAAHRGGADGGERGRRGLRGRPVHHRGHESGRHPGGGRGRVVQAPGRLTDSNEIGLQATSHYHAKAYNYPCGCHVCEVEIDPETGALALVRYTRSTITGWPSTRCCWKARFTAASRRGLGQALIERVVYDPDSGQLLTGSFMDYGIPRAGDLPAFRFERNCVPRPHQSPGGQGLWANRDVRRPARR